MKMDFLWKFLKSLKTLCLVLALAFPLSSLTQPPTRDDSEIRSTSSSQQTSDSKTKLDEHLQAHFVDSNGRDYIFNHDRKASQDFNRECSNEYGSFVNAVESFFAASEKSPMGWSAKDLKRSQVVRSLVRCEEFLDEEYVKWYENNTELNVSLLPGIRKVFGSVDKNPYWPKELENLKEFVEELRQFEICVKNVREGDFEHNVGVVMASLRTGYSSSGERGLEKHCFDIKQSVEAFVEGHEFQHLAGLPGLCGGESKEGCVADLQVRAALVQDQNVFMEKNLFGICSKETMETAGCCESLKGCEKVSEQDKQNIESHLQALVSGASADICSSGNADIQAAERSYLQETKNLCSQVVQMCQAHCEGALKDFKTAFLKCFYVPDFNGQHQSEIHSGKPCSEKMNTIKQDYLKNSQKFGKSKAQTLSLASPVQEIGNCEGPIDRINQNLTELEARVKSDFQAWCNEVAQEQGDNSLNVPKFGTASNDFDSDRDRSSGKNSRKIASSGGSDSWLGESYSRNPEGSMGSREIAGASSEDLDFGNVSRPPGSDSEGAHNDDGGATEFSTVEDEAPPTSGEQMEDSLTLYPVDPSKGECLGICPEGTAGYPVLSKYYDRMKEEQRMADEAESQRADRAWEDWRNKKDFGSFGEQFKEGVYAGFNQFVKKPLKRAYRALVGEPKPSPPKRLRELLPGLHPPGTDLMARQMELIKMFCETHPCEKIHFKDTEN